MIIKPVQEYPAKREDRTLHIYLPPDYDTSGERYPVMYFFDGHNLFSDADATYGKSWGLAEFLDRWDKPFIIVGVECSHTGTERLGEYSPYRAETGLFSQNAPLGEETVRWIAEDIKPRIDCEFRTWPHREATGIGGSSMGGLMALYGVTTRNDVFSKAACVSSSIGFCMEPLLNDMRRSAIDSDTRVYLSWGTREAQGLTDLVIPDEYSDAGRCNRKVQEYLQKRGASAQLYCQPGGGHCEADWERQIPIFMEYLWK